MCNINIVCVCVCLSAVTKQQDGGMYKTSYPGYPFLMLPDPYLQSSSMPPSVSLRPNLNSTANTHKHIRTHAHAQSKPSPQQVNIELIYSVSCVGSGLLVLALSGFWLLLLFTVSLSVCHRKCCAS